MYPSGISCTMPEEHQVKMIRCIPGLEKCELLQAGKFIYNFKCF